MRKHLMLAIVGPLKGLGYVIFLPLIGIFTILVVGLMIGAHKLATVLRTSSKSPSALQDEATPASRVSSRR